MQSVTAPECLFFFASVSFSGMRVRSLLAYRIDQIWVFFPVILHVVGIMLMHVHLLLSKFSIRKEKIKQGSVGQKSTVHVPDPI